jgi:16S rRNA (guanine1207-N2)-methyltransferase
MYKKQRFYNKLRANTGNFMATSNINQLLIRNIDGISATTPLFVNITNDGFIAEYLAHHPKANITCYHTNFADYKLSQAVKSQQVTSRFCVEYKTQAKHDLVIINFPKSKAEFGFTLAMLAESMTEDASVIMVGENKGGIKSADKLSKKHLTFCHKVDAARHCLLYVGQFQSALPKFELEQFYKYYTVSIGDISLKVAALPGVFSQSSLDIGTEVLLENLPQAIKGKVLDFGCGAGVIAAFIGKISPSTKLTLVDVSALALQSAKTTLALNELSGECIASDSLSDVQARYDFVISNPPFHQGVKTHYAATEQFLTQIKQHLTAQGCITIVANSFLKYPPIMEKAIGPTKTLAIKKGFAVYQCLTQAKN